MRSGSWASKRVRQIGFDIPGLQGQPASLKVTRELPSALPDQAASVGGVSQATGSVSLSADPLRVQERSGSWFSRKAWPQTGERVTANVTDGTNTHRVFTGSTDEIVSTFADPTVDASLVDDTDMLSAPVSASPLFREMPPLSTTGDGQQRMTGLLNTHLACLAARTAGFYNTPPQAGFCLLSVPLTGSTWPERGQLKDSYRASNIGGWARFQPGAYTDQGNASVFMTNVFARYVPDPYNTPWSGGITAARPMTITLCARQSQATSCYVAARWWSGTAYDRKIRFAVTGSRDLSAQIEREGQLTTIVILRAAEAQAWECASLRIKRLSTNVLEFTITTDTGASATRTTDIGGLVMRDTLWDEAQVYIPTGCGLNGVQIHHATTAPESSTFSRNFFYRPDTPLNSMYVMPSLEAIPAKKLLDDLAKAECAAAWIDEDGNLQWAGLKYLKSRPVARTVTSSELANARIEMKTQDVRRSVTVRYNPWVTRTARRSSIVVHEGSKDEYVAGDKAETIITSPSDEEWVQVDSTLREVYNDTDVGQLNTGQGSYHGYCALYPDGKEFGQFDNTGRTSFSFQPIGPNAWKWTFEVLSLPSTVDRIRTTTRSDETSYTKPAYRGKGLPLLRAMGVGTSSDEAESSGRVGPAWAPDLEHDVTWYLQSKDRAKALADFIANELKAPKPRITNLDILPDPRLQLGDKIRVIEPARTGLELVGLVVRIDQIVSTADHRMTLDLLILEVTASQVTLGEFDAFYDGMSLSKLDAVFGQETLAQRDNTPLRK